ncbi:MAG TPA: hypothetical protein VG245_03245 [Candidatus Dormibacteraeota bacterium]|jgi:hypothetical protein|nr:hypothetical protein [Candidatus Dormibacteraeota bacterium]
MNFTRTFARAGATGVGALVALAAVGAAPMAASAETVSVGCSNANAASVSVCIADPVGVGQLMVGVNPGGGGRSQLGNNTVPGVYAVAQSNATSGNQGYIGISNWGGGGTDSGASSGDNGPTSECVVGDSGGPGPAGSSNSGGTVMLKPLCNDTIPNETVEDTLTSTVYTVYVPVACGHTTGGHYFAPPTPRNGCWVP